MKGLWELTPVWVLIHWALHCGTLEIHKQSYYGAVLALAFSRATPRMYRTSACMTGYIRIYIYIIFWSNSASWNSVSQSMTEVKDETALIPLDLNKLLYSSPNLRRRWLCGWGTSLTLKLLRLLSGGKEAFKEDQTAISSAPSEQ